MIQLSAPVAIATPDGHVDIDPQLFADAYPGLLLDWYIEEQVEAAEDLHRDRLISAVTERELDRREFSPQASNPSVGSRRAVMMEADVIRRFSYSIGDAVRNERSRSHKLKKSKLRIERRGR